MRQTRGREAERVVTDAAKDTETILWSVGRSNWWLIDQTREREELNRRNALGTGHGQHT